MTESQTPHSDWTHNVQIVRLWMPPMKDDEHHQNLIGFSKDLDLLLVKWFGLGSMSSYMGFYRANIDWDNVDTPNACMNTPNRGERTPELDNEP